MKLRHPIKSDPRYTIDLEHCGHPQPRYVLRFCNEWIMQSPHYSACVVRATGHKAERNGSLVITEIPA